MDKKPEGLKGIVDGFKGLFRPKASAAVVEQGPDQKRKLTRIRCEYRVECLAEGKTFAGIVVDMGLGGMRLKVTREVKPGSALAVRYDAEVGYLASGRYAVDTVNTQVVWCRKKAGSDSIEAAVTYNEPEDVMGKSWVKFILRQLGFDSHGIRERRRDVRVKAGLAANLRAEGTQGDGVDGVVANLSAGGCMFEGDLQARMFSRITAYVGSVGGLRPIKFTGTVVWIYKVPDEPKLRLGIRFESMKSEDTRLVGRYVAHLVRQAAVQM